jgi:hypothetical protein
MLVLELTVNEVAGTPPIATEFVPVKFEPEMLIDVPVVPSTGVNVEILGGPKKIKPGALPTPPGAVTEMLPSKPDPTTAVMVVLEVTVKEEADAPPKLTAVASLKLVPVIVIVAPCTADVGVNEVIVGAGIKVKPANVAMPVGVVTKILPLAPAATVATILVFESTLNEEAGVPPKLTEVASVKSIPVMVT